MRAVTFLLVALLWASSAFAQATLQQGGSTTQGRVPAYRSGGSQQPIVVDSGPAGGNTIGQGISELNVTARGTGSAPYAGQGTGQLGTIFQIQDAVSTNSTGYHALSFSANAQGGGLIAYNAFGGASPLPLKLNLNGQTYEFPFSSGGVQGPVSSTVGDLACWNNTSGTLLSDCGGKIGVTPAYFGATPGTGDNTAALKAAFESGMQIYMDAYYPAIGPVVVSGCPSIRGGNASTGGIVFSGTGGGIVINCPNTPLNIQTGRVFLSNFGILTSSSAGGGTALTINFGPTPPAAAPLPNLDMEYVKVAGTGSYKVNYWTDGVVIKNAETANLYGNFIIGHADFNADMASGVTITNDANVPAMGVNILANSIYAVNKAVYSLSFGTPNIEGVVVRDNILVSNIYGIYIDNTAGSGGYSPSFYLESNQTSSSGASIYTNHISQLFIKGNTLYTYGAASPCIEIVATITVLIDNTNVCVNIFPGGGTAPAIRVTGSGPGQIMGGTVVAFGSAVELASTAVGWQVWPMTHSAGSVTTVTNAAVTGANYIVTNDGNFMTFNGFVNISSSLALTNGHIRAGCNSQVLPASATTTYQICTNFATLGEMNFFNVANAGQGFSWIQKTGDATYLTMATLRPVAGLGVFYADIVTAPNASLGGAQGTLTLGGVNKAPFIDFNSYNGTMNDYDGRIQVSGGEASTDGRGVMGLRARSVSIDSGTLVRFGDLSSVAWGLGVGVSLSLPPATFTDTTSAGAVTAVYLSAFKAPTLAFSNAATVGNTYNAYFEDPIAGTNATLTNKWAIGAESLKVLLTTDATRTTRTVCQDTTNLGFYFGSGASGVCLGTSSARYKSDISKASAGLEKVAALEPVRFHYKHGYGDDGVRWQYGFLAEEVAGVLPQLVDNDKEGRPNSVDYVGLIPFMVNAIKDLKAANDNLAAELHELKRGSR